MSSLRDRKSSRIDAAVIDGPPGPRPILPEAVIGRIVGISTAGVPEVEFPGSPAAGPIAAQTAAAISARHVGHDVAIVFVGGDPLRPLILGVIRQSPDAPASQGDQAEAELRPQVLLDGERLVLTADREIELRCGKASLVLTRAGKVLIRGAYLLSRSSGVNRIKGGSVQIN